MFVGTIKQKIFICMFTFIFMIFLFKCYILAPLDYSFQHTHTHTYIYVCMYVRMHVRMYVYY